MCGKYGEFSIHFAEKIKFYHSSSFFSATCRCQKYLKALWSPVPPYAVQTETGNPTGIIPKLLSTLVSDSCGFCYEHNQSKVIYELKSSRTKRDNVFDEADDADFEFPIRKSDKVGGIGSVMVYRALPCKLAGIARFVK